MQEVTVSRVVGLAWARFKANAFPFIGLFLLAAIVSLIPIVGSLAYLLVFSPALARLSLVAIRQGKASFEQAFSPFGKLLEAGLFLLVIQLVPALLILLGYGSSFLALFSMAGGEDMESGGGAWLSGSFVLVVLGVILVVLFSLFFWAGPYFILDSKKGMGEAFGASFSLFQRHVGQVIGLLVVSVVILLLGGLACGVGVLVAGPVVQLAWAALYVGLAEGALPEAATGGQG